jgi:hypothetical protein
LTAVGADATRSTDKTNRLRALRIAALNPQVFGLFFRDYANKKLPSQDMLPKILHTEYGVPEDLAGEGSSLICSNGKLVELIREIGGSPHILMESELVDASSNRDTEPASDEIPSDEKPDAPVGEAKTAALPEAVTRLPDNRPNIAPSTTSQSPRPIFVGHGKNKAPLQQLQALLTAFQIPHKVVIDEANLGRPISQKVRDTIEECGSAILIFTRDEQFSDKDGKEIWRPSENVVYELGTTSYVYGDRS